ncbi:MAG: CPBP family intramembrane metalloprotease [Gammaproteobacteria bacterium]|nr:MAG: CPBP family intramembrane metalloprotease [Gammaproteobacteria bacterium]
MTPNASPSNNHKILVALLTAAFCLLFVHYLKYNVVFNDVLSGISSLIKGNPKLLAWQIRSHTYGQLYSQAWWGLIHLFGFMLIPCACIKWVFNEKIADYGLQAGDVRSHLKWYLFLTAPILCFAVIVSFRADFSSKYPFYNLAFRSWSDLILWEIIYVIQFISLEFFFRGFMLRSTQHVFGSNAILVMCLPYTMLHFQKPWLEATGAIAFGLFLGVLAMRSRSIWGGVGVHVSIALTMDFAALIQTRGLPQQLLP